MTDYQIRLTRGSTRAAGEEFEVSHGRRLETLAAAGVAHFVRPELFEGIQGGIPTDTARFLKINGGLRDRTGPGRGHPEDPQARAGRTPWLRRATWRNI